MLKIFLKTYFDQYAGTNAKLNAVKDNVIRMASNDRSTNRSAESSESFINDIKEAILANDMPTGEKPMLEYFYGKCQSVS